MDKKQVIAVVIVMIMIVAAVAAAVAMGNDDTDEKGHPTELTLLNSDFSPSLQVYGNVNGDLTIDEKDVETLEKAIKAGTATKLPLADVNGDNRVDEKDVECIKNIINATLENPVTVKHLNRYTEGDYWTESKYPINSMAISASANIVMMLKYLDIKDEIKAVAYYSKIDSVMYSDYQQFFVDSTSKFDITKPYEYLVGASAGYFAKELVVNHINDDKITAIITADNASTYLAGKGTKTYGMTEQEATDLGLGVIRVASASTSPESYLSDLALLGFMCQKDASKVQAMADWYKATISDINAKLNANVGKTVDQVDFAVSSATKYSKSSDGTIDTYNYISSSKSDYTAAVTAAGGYFALKNYDFGDSTSSKKMTDLGKWLADYNIDKLIVIKTGSGFSWYGGNVLTDGLKTVQSCALAFSDSSPYYNNEVYVLSGDMPLLLRTIYSACILYPELFTTEWADNYNVQHCTQFLGLDEQTVRSGQYYVSMTDMGLSGH